MGNGLMYKLNSVLGSATIILAFFMLPSILSMFLTIQCLFGWIIVYYKRQSVPSIKIKTPLTRIE